jgi:hypothetical protein
MKLLLLVFFLYSCFQLNAYSKAPDNADLQPFIQLSEECSSENSLDLTANENEDFGNECSIVLIAGKEIIRTSVYSRLYNNNGKTSAFQTDILRPPQIV